MSWNRVALDDVPPMPWRNGGGVTRELLAWPAADAWRVRLSVADIERDGPFSRFEGRERGFAVLEGAGVLLRFAQRDLQLTQGSEPLHFDGADPVDCRLLDGPTRDFNLMAPQGRGRLWRVRGARRCTPEGPALVAAYAHRQSLRLVSGAAAIDVPAGQLAWRHLHAGTSVDVEAEDALWVEVRP